MPKLSHLNARGEAAMVDVSAKDVTARSAVAEGFVAMAKETLALIESGEAKKGDVLATARIAGIMAAKRTHELIPLCHPLAITKVAVDFAPQRDPAGIHVTAEVKVAGQTGVEMEALTAVSVACLTIYDMLKAADKAMRFDGIRLLEKTGGRSGTYRAAPSPAQPANAPPAPSARKAR
jgi:cyclic pyranopterin phosphate synthase